MSLIGIDVRKLGDFGIGTYIRNLLSGLSELDQEHKYLLLRKAETDPAELPTGMESRIERSGLYSPAEPWRLGWNARRAGLDLLHCPHYVTPFLAGCPLAVTIHDLIHLLFPRYLPGRTARRYARFFLRRAARKAKVIFAVSNCTRDDILEHLPAREEQIIVTYEAVDPAMSREPGEAELEEVRTRYALDRPFILYVGNLKPHKNLGIAVEAFARFRNQAGPEWQFVIVGGEPADGALRRTIESSGVRGSVRFLGFLPKRRLPAVYRLARTFLFPSLYEGFGLPPLEAMVAGTPVVASNISSLPEVLGDAALLVDPRDADAMAAALEKIETDEELRGDLVERGRQRARRYSWRETTELTLAGYRRALGQAGGEA